MITLLTELHEFQTKVQSPSLRLQKFVTLDKKTQDLKKQEIEAVVACQNRYGRSIPLLQHPFALSFKAKLESRLIVNQAGGILENAGLCLHRHFGSPYIPGSAVKGVTRHVAWCDWQAEEDPTVKQVIARKMVAIFGFPIGEKAFDEAMLSEDHELTSKAGNIAFLPAYPESKVTLDVDLVNCHHAKYYASHPDFPSATDNEPPNPQFFPAVAKGSSFCFSLIPLHATDRALAEQAKQWLIRALTQNGVGAKTGAGYGWFSFDAAAEAQEQLLRLEKERQRAEAEKEKTILASMTPFDRATKELLSLPSEPFVHFAKALREKSEDEQRAFIRVLKTNKDKKEWWKMKKRRDVPLASAILTVASLLKEDLQ